VTPCTITPLPHLADNLLLRSFTRQLRSFRFLGANAASETFPYRAKDGETILVWRWVPERPDRNFPEQSQIQRQRLRWHFNILGQQPSIAVLDFGTRRPAYSCRRRSQPGKGGFFCRTFHHARRQRTASTHWLHIRIQSAIGWSRRQLNSDFALLRRRQIDSRSAAIVKRGGAF